VWVGCDDVQGRKGVERWGRETKNITIREGVVERGKDRKRARERQSQSQRGVPCCRRKLKNSDEE